jgi:hypothetical protein
MLNDELVNFSHVGHGDDVYRVSQPWSLRAQAISRLLDSLDIRVCTQNPRENSDSRTQAPIRGARRVHVRLWMFGECSEAISLPRPKLVSPSRAAIDRKPRLVLRTLSGARATPDGHGRGINCASCRKAV